MILFWPPIVEPLWRFLTGDEEYLMSYTKGFSELPTPSQVGFPTRTFTSEVDEYYVYGLHWCGRGACGWRNVALLRVTSADRNSRAFVACASPLLER